MPKKVTSSFLDSRPYTRRQKEKFAAELSRLAGEFDDHSSRLRTSSDPQAPIAGIRAVMARAGRLLADLVQRAAVAAPTPLPSWLAWRIRPAERPILFGYGDASIRLSGAPSTLNNLLAAVSPRRQPLRGAAETWQGEHAPEEVHDRLVFLEAVDDWLGKACTPQPHLRLPEARFLVDRGTTGLLRDEKHISVVIDWEGRAAPASALLFLDVGPACAAVCRHLAEMLVSDTSSAHEATIFDLTLAWHDATEAWRSHIMDGNRGGAPLRLHLEQDPTDEDSSRGTIFDITPTPTGSYRDKIVRHVGFAAFAARCHRLAEVTRSAIAVLMRFEEPIEPAEALVRELQHEEPIPTREGWDATYFVQRQLERIDSRIWNGELPDDEDRMERAAVWAHERKSLATTAAIRKFDAAVATVMKGPRVSENELELRNMASRLRDEEKRTVPFARIMAMPRHDAKHLCEVWCELVNFGFQFFEQNSSDPESAFYDFRTLLSFPRSIPDSPAHQWVRALATTTKELQPYANAKGIGVDKQLALFALERGLERLMEHEKVQLRPLVEDVRSIVKCIMHSAKASDSDLASNDGVSPRQGDPREPQGVNAQLDFSGTSEKAVTAIVRAVADLRAATPDVTPTKERIKDKAGKTGGAGDRAVQRAIRLRLLTPDYWVTDQGAHFLAERS